jgi:hypothetical protein
MFCIFVVIQNYYKKCAYTLKPVYKEVTQGNLKIMWPSWPVALYIQVTIVCTIHNWENDAVMWPIMPVLL